jgi:hypothetical protein
VGGASALMFGFDARPAQIHATHPVGAVGLFAGRSAAGCTGLMSVGAALREKPERPPYSSGCPILAGVWHLMGGPDRADGGLDSELGGTR